MKMTEFENTCVQFNPKPQGQNYCIYRPIYVIYIQVSLSLTYIHGIPHRSLIKLSHLTLNSDFHLVPLANCTSSLQYSL